MCNREWMPHLKSTRRRTFLKLSLLCALAITHRSARAQKPTFLVVPVPPGGGMDTTARLLTEAVRPTLGQILVDNRPGAALRIGLQAVRQAAPDGTWLLYTPISPFTIYPFVYKKLGFDAERDLIPIAPVVSFEFALGVPGNSPVSTVAEYLQAAKRNPGQDGLYAVPGAGTSVHFAGAALAYSTGVDLVYVPYKGSAPAMQDLIGANVPACFNVLGEFLQYRRSGKVKVLATTGAKRSPFMPDVPTFTELGFKGMALNEQFGLFAPAKTPMTTVEKISSAVLAAVRQPDFVRRVGELGYTTLPMSPQEFADKLKADRAAWAPIVKATGFTIDE